MTKDRRVVDIASAAADVETASQWTELLEKREAERSGVRIVDARRTVARRAGVLPGTLENLRSSRLKVIATHVFQRLRGAVIRELEFEVLRLEHELTLLRASGADPRQNAIAEVVADLARIRKTLGLPEGAA